MTKVKLISIVIIVVVIILLSIVAIKWHNDQVELNVRESISKTEGKIQELLKQDSLKALEISSYKSIIDSAKQIKHDTISIYKKKFIQSNIVNNLGTDASITFLSNNLSQ